MYLGWVASDPDNLESTTAPPSLPLSVTFLKENVDSRDHMQGRLPNFLLCAKVNPTFLHANIWTHVQIVQHQVESQPVAYYWEELCVSGKHSWSSFLFEWLMQGAEPRHWREPYWLSQMQFYLLPILTINTKANTATETKVETHAREVVQVLSSYPVQYWPSLVSQWAENQFWFANITPTTEMTIHCKEQCR